MAATHTIHQAREAVDFAYNAAGATAIFENHPLERRFRDIHTVTQQLQGQLRHFETVGAWMMGAEADLTFVVRRRRYATRRTATLHHRTPGSERTKQFVSRHSRARERRCPPLDFPGYWLYSGGVMPPCI